MLLAPGFYSHEDTANELGISPEELTRRVKAGEIKGYHVSTRGGNSVQRNYYTKELIDRLKLQYKTENTNPSLEGDN